MVFKDSSSIDQLMKRSDILRFFLKGRLKLSRYAEEAVDDLETFFTEANGTLLARGASPGDGARVLSWSLEDDVIHLEIGSEGPIRAHDALLRLKNGIGRELGKKHRLGVRNSYVDLYEITFSLEYPPVDELTIPYAASVRFEGMECTLRLENVDEVFLRENYIDRMISLIRDKTAGQHYKGKGEYWEEIWRSPQREIVYQNDPTEDMVEKKWIKQGPTKGKWFLRPEITKIMRIMEQIAINEVLAPLGFQEIIASHMVPFEIWIKTGHMAGSPNEFYYVSEPATRDPAAWETFSDLVKITRKVPYEELGKCLAGPRAGICYAQCPVIYWSFKSETLADDSLPVLLFERTANSGRYESGGRHGMERVDEFHRIEPVYIGTKEQMLEIRHKMLDAYKHVFNDILELEWRMARVTPFYMQQSGGFGLDDPGSEEETEKSKGTIDFEAYMPYRGGREDSEWLEFQNFSIVGDKYTRAFNIKSQTKELWSGCSGIGLERWSTAFLAQYGLSPDSWPSEFRRIYGKMPSGIRFL